MPVTPLHVGPALVAKPLLGRYFSVLVFAFANGAMDIEPIVRFLLRDAVLHGFTHTYVGATLLGAVSLAAGKPLCEWFLRRFQADAASPFLVWLHGPDRIGWGAAALSAFAGTYSHVLLDSIMHGDMEPFFPWSKANGLLLAVPVDTLNLACVVSGAVGLAFIGAAYLLSRRRAHPAPPRSGA